MTTETSLDELRNTIRTCPIIDNHAHNLLRPHQLKTADFLNATSEAEGEALLDHVKALPHLRAVRQLRKLYELPAEAEWDAILKRRKELLDADAKGLIKRCLAGTQTILIDDGLDGSFEKYSWHDQFTASPCKRIVRIEAIAAEILAALHQQGKLPVGVAIADEEACQLAWVAFITAFEQAIAAYLEDEDVAGFKSVVCYRTGLDVEVGRDIEVTEAGSHSFRRYFLPHCTRTKFRVQTKGMNDALVISTCKLIEAFYKGNDIAKPFQFHTGLGDNDISLLDSNPACMQPLIKAFPAVPFVLLHSSYPYTREAGYLATVYKNVYLDIGEVFPMISRDGQEQIVRQALEITPTSKILWSTDGHHHPETYWLANVQGREVTEKILCDYVNAEDWTIAQAVQAAKDIFFENSNALYDLGLDIRGTATVGSHGDTTTGTQGIAALGSSMTNLQVANTLPRTLAAGAFGATEFVFVQWLDYMAQLRTRWLPIEEFTRLMSTGPGRLGISRGNLATTQNDLMSSVAVPVGMVYVTPEMSSFKPMQDSGPVKNAATVMARYTDEEGNESSACPRATLQHLADTFKTNYDIDFLAGFEIEIAFFRRKVSATSPEDLFTPLDTNHAWGTFSDEQYMVSISLMNFIATQLRKIGIAVHYIHAESGGGQYEFVLPPSSPVQAVDMLIQAKQCIQQIAATKGLRATCHPMPTPGIGTGSHVHVSLNSKTVPQEKLLEMESSFFGNVLTHLRAICAITLSQPESYGRVVDDSWCGGTWVAWGTNNREVPVRRVSPCRWEVRCLDGFANPYLALCIVIGAGLAGIRNGAQLTLKDCPVNPTKLSDEAKKELGIVDRLPRTLEESVEALKKDAELQKAVNEEILGRWIEVKKAEQEMLAAMGEQEKRVWLMERY